MVALEVQITIPHSSHSFVLNVVQRTNAQCVLVMQLCVRYDSTYESPSESSLLLSHRKLTRLMVGGRMPERARLASKSSHLPK